MPPRRRRSVRLPAPWPRHAAQLSLAAGVLVAGLTLSASASAAPPTSASGETSQDTSKVRKRLPYRAVEIQANMAGQLLPKPSFGLDGAFVFGTETFQMRIGALIQGTPGFRLASGKIANVLGAATADACVAKNVYRNQIRMCVGGQAGGMAHQWIGYDRPGRKLTGWWAGTLQGDYRYAITEGFGVMFGVGVVVPVVGPAFRAYDQFGSPTPLVFPGPVGGTMRLGTSWRF